MCCLCHASEAASGPDVFAHNVETVRRLQVTARVVKFVNLCDAVCARAGQRSLRPLWSFASLLQFFAFHIRSLWNHLGSRCTANLVTRALLFAPQSTVRDRRANWEQSLSVLTAAKEMGVKITKTSIMLGCGEERDEVVEAMKLLRGRGVDVLTLGEWSPCTLNIAMITI